jgi:hypothetical protein
LTPLADANDIRMVKGFFDGGEPINLHLHSPAVTLGNGQEVVVKSVQSLHSGYCLDQTAMDAMVYLFAARDLQLCDAHKQVNEKLRGYVDLSSFVQKYPMFFLMVPHLWKVYCNILKFWKLLLRNPFQLAIGLLYHIFGVRRVSGYSL